jgi:hypothetical protein
MYDAPRARLLGRMKSGLFWRTFLLLSFLTALSMASWIGMINVFQRGPQAQNRPPNCWSRWSPSPRPR